MDSLSYRCLCASARKEGRLEERKEYYWLICYRSTGLVCEGRDFLIHSRPFTFFSSWNPLFVFEFSGL